MAEPDDEGLLTLDQIEASRAKREAASGISDEEMERLVLTLQNACTGFGVRADVLELAYLICAFQVTGAYVPRAKLERHVKRMSAIWLKHARIAEKHKGELWPLNTAVIAHGTVQ